MNYRLTKDIPLYDNWDVIILGGGPAGCTAAAAAAREGARTLLVEATGVLGGMGTSGLVPAWCPFSDQEKMIYRGLAEKVFHAAKAGMPHVADDARDWVPIDAEWLKQVYDNLVTEAGAKTLFFTRCVGVERDAQGNLDAVLLANKSGLSAYQATVYVDATGDADLCAFAGADFNHGDDQGATMPATLCFLLTNVDEYAYLNGPELYQGNPHSPAWDMAADADYPLIRDYHLCQNLVGPRAVGFNAGHLWNVDAGDPWAVSETMFTGRRLARQIRDALAKYHPRAFANAYLAHTAPLPGIRESRRIVGDYLLTLQDWKERRSFADEICRNCYFIDMHVAEKEVQAELQNRQAGPDHQIRYDKGESHGIPYRCLIPRQLRNVLVAGRSISCERPVQASVRVMPVCLAMGEAAGLAAALAAAADSPDVRAVDANELRRRLRSYGAYLP